MSTLGERIERACERAGVSRKELAVVLKVSYSAVCKYAENHRRPNSDLLREIARAAGTTTDYLLGLTDDPGPSQVREGAATKLYEGTEGLTPEELQEWRGYADWLRERRKRKGPSHNSHPETPQT